MVSYTAFLKKKVEYWSLPKRGLDFAELIGLESVEQIQKRIDDQILSLDQVNVTGKSKTWTYAKTIWAKVNSEDLLVDLFVSMSKHILADSTSLDKSTREKLIQDHHDRCLELLHTKSTRKPLYTMI